ncbi:MAG: zinc ABC transporter substrate-binding protein [Parachlamydiales bacterium]|jgi:zinc transport system substrate-binding protein
MLLRALFFCIFVFTGLTGEPHVLVTIPVYKGFIQRIAGDKVIVDLMVPVGASAHTYEPTPKQVIQASKADLWFTTGELFETRALNALQAYNKNLKQVDLRQGLSLITAGHHCQHCSHNEYDLHFWLSPRLAKQQVETIVKALQARYPQDSQTFAANGNSLLKDLTALDQELTGLLGDGSVKRLIVVAHPAYGYMDRDYGVEQLSIEVEGKDPTPKQLTSLVTRAKKTGIQVIYTEPQYPNKGAKLIAAQLNVPTLELDPYAEDYFTMMRNTGREFAKAPIVK